MGGPSRPHTDSIYTCPPPPSISQYTIHSPNTIMAYCTRSTHPVPRHYSFGLWVTSILLFTAATTPTTKGCVEGERDALLDFKTGIVKDPSSRLSSWRGRVDCCRWSGVVCDNRTGHVVELNLQNSDPYYSETSIGGDIRPSLLLLTHLERLNLSHNDFGGIQIPKFLGSLTELTYLDLSWSNFRGAIPPQLGNLSRLRYLDLNSLYDLTIDGLHWLSRLTSLRYLYMGGVNLSVASHDWLQAVNMLSSLEELHLHDCGLTILHSSLSHVNLTTLATLDLHRNLFNSTFPNWLWKLHNLSYLDLGFSMFHGAIPAGIGNLTGLRELYLGDNSLSGPIPTEIGICNSLKLIDLRDNSIFGPIPAGIGNLTGLRKLYLDHNSLFGPIPAEIGNMAGLRELYLDHNSLFGVIPAGIGKLTSLGVLYLNDNSLFGPIPVGIGNLTGLGELYLNDNSLSGEIPIEIGSLSMLQTLNLSRNNFVGQIPAAIGAMKSLETLDLSFNKLSGVIPQSFSALNSLNHLNLSYNNLSGPIPSGNQLRTLEDASIYIGNVHLCGPPVTKSCSDDPNVDSTEEEYEQGSHVLSFYFGTGLGYLVGLWSVFVIMLFKKDWRLFYFATVDKMYDRAYVAIKIRMRNWHDAAGRM
ncbi:receptor-like protein EIX2 [Musa acuminata AAA Group]|uniref:receptor-like protein EIX2 n=1 Tax=Musa acuminata AAA Group TaxID=214697 RepID=UPI0031D27BF4